MKKPRHKEVKKLAQVAKILSDRAEIQTPGIRFQSLCLEPVLHLPSMIPFYDPAVLCGHLSLFQASALLPKH